MILGNRKGQLGQIMSSFPVMLLVFVVMFIFVIIANMISLGGNVGMMKSIELGDESVLFKSFEIDGVETFVLEFSLKSALNDYLISNKKGDIEKLKNYSDKGVNEIIKLIEKENKEIYGGEPSCFILFRGREPSFYAAKDERRDWLGQDVPTRTYDFRYSYIVAKNGVAKEPYNLLKIDKYVQHGDFREFKLNSEKYREKFGGKEEIDFWYYYGECKYGE